MRLRPVVLAGLAAGAVALGVAAYAERPQAHFARIALPDGTVRTIRYRGDAPPRLVTIADPFAGMDGIAATMDAQADAMMRLAFAAPGDGARPMTVAAAPAGERYSYTSTVIVDGRRCTTSVDSVAQGAGKAPATVRRISGDGCDAAAARGPAAATLHAPTPPAPPAPPAPPRMPGRDTI